MTDYRSRGRAPSKRVALVVAQFNEAVTTRLLDGALQLFDERKVPPDAVDVIRVPGAFELAPIVSAIAAGGRHAAVVALAAVVRGETPHFDYICTSASQALQDIGVTHRIPIGFGVLTTDTMAQAMARAGGEHGNKGYEAAQAALDVADVLDQLRSAST